jgi:DNA-binding transcriptional regulator YdaS (Cro superfamily)
MNAIQKASQYFGSRSKLAARLGVSGEAVRKWEVGRVPAERCIEIERITDGAVTRADLRPDLFAPAAAA